MIRHFLRVALVAALSLGLAGSPALAFTYSTALKNARQDAITTAIGTSGFLKLYPTGTTTCSGTVIVALPLSATAAPAASGGVLTFNAITTTNATSSGTAICATLTTSGGTVVVDGISVGTSGANINLVNNVITASQPVSVSSLTITHP
jgi:threonine/homoserine/homoserine lactone efflux protein